MNTTIWVLGSEVSAASSSRTRNTRRGGGGPARKSPQQDSAPTSPASANYDSDDIENVYEEEEDI